MKNKNLKWLKNNEEIYVLLYMLYKDFLDPILKRLQNSPA